MTKKTKIALLSIPVVVGIILIFRQFAKGQKVTSGNNPLSNAVQSVTTQKCTFPLKKGTYNCDYVRQMQEAFNTMSASSFAEHNNAKYLPLAEDGDFGSKTEAVLMDFYGKEIWVAEPQLSEEDFNQLLMFKGQ